MSLCFVILLIICLSVPISAGPTGLVVIPTADIRESGTYEIEYQMDGRKTLPADVEISLLNTQFGIARRLEAGVDFNLSGNIETDVFLNVKYGFPIRNIKGAVGVYNIGNQARHIPYTVFSTAPGRVEFTAGVQRFNDSIQSLIGVSYKVGRLILSADHISGDMDISSMGFEYALSDRFAVQWGWLFSDDAETDDAYTLHLIFSSWFR